MTERATRRPRAAAVGIVALLAFAPAAMGCPVCFGAAQGTPAAQAMNNAILFLLAIVALVQLGFAALFWSWWRRARTLSGKSRPYSLIDGGLS